MNVEQFNGLLKAKHPEATAYVPRQSGNRQTRVSVTFRPGARSYEYRGFIYEIAERLGLIDERDFNVIARRVMKALETQAAITDHAGASDTIRYFGCDVIWEEVGADEYGRRLHSYSKNTRR